jgi:hypothetical protein
VPIYRKIPGLRFNAFYKYSSAGDKPPEWDYVYVEVWDSKEAHDKAMGKYIGLGTESELAKTGYYENQPTDGSEEEFRVDATD